MQTLKKKEWIAVIIAVAVILLLLGSRFMPQVAKVTVADQITNIDTSVSATTTNNNNMNQNDLVIEDIVVGAGAEAKNGNLVSVQYTGKFADGKVFDSSIPRGEPIEFTLGVGKVIKGWDQGILGMKVGGKRTLTIPSNLAYGPNDYQQIPGGSTLYFDVELVGVKLQ